LNNRKPKLIVFADLDGTLLNEKYSSKEVEPTLNQLLSLNVSIVFNSSKTKSEIAYYRKKLRIKDPFIVENGSAIIIPNKYFQFNYVFSKHTSNYKIIELGTSYASIRKKLSAVKGETGATIVGFGDMTAENVAKDSGLPLYLARFAKKRHYSEPFKILSGKESGVLQAICKEGLCYVKGGRYFHATGSCDKGKAILILKELFLHQYPEIFTIGVGDSDNDLPMLKVVDEPFYVKDTAEKKAVWSNIQAIAEAKLTGHN
jgi:mannosyl-3-phosphoglycerate phosphatase